LERERQLAGFLVGLVQFGGEVLGRLRGRPHKCTEGSHYALSEVGNSRPAAFLLSIIPLVIALGVAAVLPSRAAALELEAQPETVHISFASQFEPVVDVAEVVTVSGATPYATSAAKLLVYTIAGARSCPSQGPSGPNESVETVLGPPNVANTTVPAGSFSQTYSVSFASVGYVALCAYLGGAFPEGKTLGNAMDEAILEVQPPTPHLTALKVTARSHTGSTASKPGDTELLTRATGGGDLRMTLKRHGRTRAEDLGYKSSGRFIVPWSCNSPGGLYVYTITVTDEYGKTLTSRGKFRPVSAARCRALRIADTRRRPGEERRHREEAAGRQREEEQLEREVEQIKRDQRAACEQGLGGRVERVSESIEIPPVPKDTETECEVSGRVVTLQGDPPKVVNVRP
jgi:hypothetical protein